MLGPLSAIHKQHSLLEYHHLRSVAIQVTLISVASVHVTCMCVFVYVILCDIVAVRPACNYRVHVTTKRWQVQAPPAPSDQLQL